MRAWGELAVRIVINTLPAAIYVRTTVAAVDIRKRTLEIINFREALESGAGRSRRLGILLVTVT